MSFIINRWVRGDDFHGREPLLQEIRNRNRSTTWVLGNRRVGKTSLLRQIEWLCRQDAWPGHLALYWDLQGAATAEGLKDSFLECLEDTEEVADSLGLDPDDLEDFAFPEIMNKFRRKVKGLKDKRLLLLIDECEELVDVNREEPNILAPFRKLTQGDYPFALIMAGSYRMMDLDESTSRTSLFLPDFLPPLLLGPFTNQVCLELLGRQGIGQDMASAIYNLTFGNPHLVQVFGEHYSRAGDLDMVLNELRHTKVCHYFFQSNFQCLPETMRTWWVDGSSVDNLEKVSTGDANFPYLRQSALVRAQGDDVLISPLLKLLVRNEEPEFQTSTSEPTPAKAEPEVSKPTPKKQPPATPDSPVKAILEKLRGAAPDMTVLPTTWFEGNQLGEDLPPALNLMASLGESSDVIHGVLNRATPEYVRGEKGGAATTVYGAGLLWYHALFKQAPFQEISDPWERAGAISDRDVPLTDAMVREAGLPAVQAMILMRCLKANAQHRYKNLDALSEDLHASTT